APGSAHTCGPARRPCSSRRAPPAPAPTPERAPCGARTCRPGRWRCRPARRAPSEAGGRASGRDRSPTSPRRPPPSATATTPRKHPEHPLSTVVANPATAKQNRYVGLRPEIDPANRRGGEETVGTEWTENRKNLMFFSGRAHPELAEQVAKELDIHVTAQTARNFANGEIFVRYHESVRGCDAFVLQSHPAPLNEWIMEQLIMIDALKRGSAKRITAILPFYPYARQDKKHRGREPISARLMADLLKTAGAHRLMAVDIHTAQVQGFFDGPVDHLLALPILASYIESRVDTSQVTVVAPDSGRVRVAEQWADRLGGCPLAFIHEPRDVSAPNQVIANRGVGDVEGRICVVGDDMIDTGGTVVKAADALLAAGAADVMVAATHGVLSDPAVDRLKNAPIREIVVTDTLPIPPERRFDNLTVLSIAPLIARAIREVF